MNVAILGASDNPERYAYKALKKLLEAGHTVFPVNPKLSSIEGHVVYAALDQIKAPIDTLTLYVSAPVSTSLKDAVLHLKPRRIIFNPGAENSDLESAARAKGIDCLQACTLVMLSTHQF